MTKYSRHILIYAFIAVGIIMNFSSCSDDNYVEPEILTETIYPDTISYLFVTGKVLDKEGNALPDMTVEYIMDGEIRSTTTDDNGRYEVRELDPTIRNKKLRCHGDGFLPKVDVLKFENNTVEKDIILAREDDFSGGTGADFSAQSLMDSLVTISGRLIDQNGDAVSGIEVIIIEINDFTFSYGISDSEGYWSITVDATANGYVAAYSQCESVEILLQDQDFGNDTEVGELVTTLIKPEIVRFSGFITDCNTGDGLIQGSIRFSFSDENRIETADIVNGAYDLSIQKCKMAECIDVTIYSYQNSVDEFLCQDFEAGANLLDFEICNDPPPPIPGGGLITHVIEGDTTLYDFGIVSESMGRYSISGGNEALGTGILFETTSLDLSGPMSFAGIIDINTFVASYASQPGQINYQIDSTTVEFMYGKYDGEMLEGATGNTVQVEGTFKARIQ